MKNWNILPMSSVDNKVIEVSGVSLCYDRLPVLENINLDIYKGDFLAITGPNGGGKTSLLRIILGLLKPTIGKVHYYRDGHWVRDLNLGYLPQKNGIDSRFPITVSEVIASGLMNGRSLGRLSVEQYAMVSEMIHLMGLEELADRPIGGLSGGQLQRTLLGRTLVSQPEILILDEPSSYVDKVFESRMYDLLKDISYKTTILLVSHEVNHVTELASRTVRINKTLQEVL